MNLWNFIKTHKKLTLAIFAGLFLIIFLSFISFNFIKKRFFPSLKLPNQITGTTEQSSGFAIMLIKTPKNIYSFNEKIPIQVIANSQGQKVTAFDSLIEYDPQFLSLATKKPPPLSGFDYFGKNNDKLISVSAVAKLDSKTQTFNGTTLFEVEFTPKKIGKTNLKLIFSPNATNDSNLLNEGSKDILSGVYGKEIEIK